MITFNDFEKAQDKKQFILDSIQSFKNSKMYKTAIDAQAYYKGENTTILKRKPVIFTNSGQKEDIFRANNQVASEFFPKIIKQENSYLLSNGLTTEDDIKKGLGNRFDVLLQKMGIYALVDSVSWGYGYISSKGFAMDVWRGTEVIPLYDERTGVIRCIIRFWQIDEEKPTFIELYEEDGKTEYETRKNNKDIMELIESKPKKAYIVKKNSDILGERVVDELNWTTLPIFPLYANDVKTSEFSVGLKSKIDLFDIINSDFGNTLEDSRDVFWVLKNYNGQDIDEFIRDYKEYKAIKVDDDGDATPHTIEVPYEARKTALEMLINQIYSDSQALNTDVLAQGQMTNDHIRAMYAQLDLKCDNFEMNAREFCINIIELYLEYKNTPEKEFKVEFDRNRLTNNTETIDNIMKMRNDISHATALRLNPYIDNVDEELALIEEEGTNKFTIVDNNVDNVNN